MRDLTIVIPFFNGHQYIEHLLNSIEKTQPVIIIDDLSNEPYQTNRENVTVYRLGRKGFFAGAVNEGIKHCSTDVLILNQDVLLKTGWQQIIEENQSEFALIGERIRGNHPMFHHGYIHGTFMYIRRDLIDDIGLLNEKLYPLWGNTAEYQLRASRSGYNVLPLSEIPQFSHLRAETEAYGSSIKQLLKNSPQAKKQLINTPPEISVIIPCHNYAKYLPDAINSLFGGDTCLGKLPAQTFQSFEVIIVDDGSNEENQTAINSFVTGWNGVRVVRLDRNPLDENGRYIGKPSALNAGINKAIGKYVTVLDCDDMMDARRLNTLYNLAEQNPNSVIYDQILSFKRVKQKVIWSNEKSHKNVIVLDTHKQTLEQETIQVSKIACANFRKTVYGDRIAFYFWPLPEYNFDELLDKNCMHSGIFFSKKAWQTVGGYNEQMVYGREDWCINIALGMNGYCGLKTEQPLYLYRREGQNRTLENTKQHWQERFVNQLHEIYYELYKGVRPMACCGNGNRNQNNNRVQTNKNISLPAGKNDGLSYVKYTGSRVGSFSVWGVSTGNQYRVNPKNPVFLVDNNDLYGSGRKQGILDIYEGTNFAFSLYEPPKTKVIEKVEVVEIMPVQESIDEAKSNPELTEQQIEALATINTLKTFLVAGNYSLTTLQLMLAYETENKNRKTAVDLLEMNINEYDGSVLFNPSNF